MRLVDRPAGQCRDQRIVADLFAEARDHGGDLGVEQRPGHIAETQDEDLDVLSRCVEHLHHRLIAEQVPEWGEIDCRCLCIDHRNLVVAGELHDAELGPIGALAHEFGIDGHEFLRREAVAQRLKGFGGGNECRRRESGAGRARHRALYTAAGVTQKHPSLLQLDLLELPGLVCRPSIQPGQATMHAYRTHTCGALRATDAGQTARLSGWVHAKRDHGGLLFIDLRDHYGITQCVFPAGSPAFAAADAVRPESVVTVTGQVVPREAGTVNPRLPTGEVELRVADLVVQSVAEVLPMQVAGDEKFPEDIRLKYRFIDLRREKLHRNIMLRSGVIASIRRRMIEAGFTEFHTPILTADSPEGARAFLVPARLHPGTFYALPQAPQQFKQLVMVAGFDRYFQIAPCFRDEAARADRSPGEFYQLDFEMSYVTQEDVFATIEPVLAGVFEEFAEGRAVDALPFRRIPYDTAMLEFGTDKPDLRNPLRISDVTQHFGGSGFGLFARIAASGGVVRAVPAPGAASQPRSFFDKLNEWARAEGAGGLGYIVYEADGPKGPIARNLEADRAEAIRAPADWRRATQCSSSPARSRRRPGSPARCAPGLRRNRAWARPARFAFAGSPISRCSSSTRNPGKSISATIRSACRRAGWRR